MRFYGGKEISALRSEELHPDQIRLSIHCVKSVCIRSYSGPREIRRDTEYLSYSVRMRENADENNSEYGHFLRSGIL